MTKQEEQVFKIKNICRFCETNLESDKVRDHCHLTGEYRGRARIKRNMILIQKHSKFVPILFHNFSDYDGHLFFEKLDDKKHDIIKLDIIPKTNKEYISVTFGCIRFIDSFPFLSGSLDSLVKTLLDNSHKTLKILKEENVDNVELLSIVNEIKLLNKEEIYIIDSIKDFKKRHFR